MNTPGPEHLLFIPGILMVGMVMGYIFGARSARAELQRRRQRAKE